MHLMYIADPADPSKRIYTLQKVIDGKVSKSAPGPFLARRQVQQASRHYQEALWTPVDTAE